MGSSIRRARTARPRADGAEDRVEAMACFQCLSAEPLGDDELKGRRGGAMARYVQNVNTFQVSMLDTPCSCATCPCCVLAACPLTHICVQCHLRHRVLNHIHPGSGWDHYICCQGYWPKCCCFAPGECGEKSCPRTCMCLEAWLCPGCAVSTTRFVVMEHYDLMPDPCDNRLIRMNNCIQLFACVCHVAAIFNRNLRALANIIDCLADVMFWTTTGCMTAQVDAEVAFRETQQAADVVYAPVAVDAYAPPDMPDVAPMAQKMDHGSFPPGD